MDVNPYEPSNLAEEPAKTRPTRWLLWIGTACLSVASTLAAVIYLAVSGFETIAESTTTPSPQDLAPSAHVGVGAFLLTIVLGLVGFLLIVAGLSIRQTDR